MKRKKDLGNIVAGYKGNHKFQKDQLSKILNLDSYHSYVSVNLSYPDDHDLIDSVLPLAMCELSKVFPFVVIRSASFHHIEIVCVHVRSFSDIFSLLYDVELNLQSVFPDVNLF